MVFCKECEEKEIKVKMNWITEIITSASERFHQWNFKTETLYQCPNCKVIVVD